MVNVSFLLFEVLGSTNTYQNLGYRCSTRLRHRHARIRGNMSNIYFLFGRVGTRETRWGHEGRAAMIMQILKFQTG